MHHEAAALSATLHESVAAALGKARTETKGYPHKMFPHLLPMVTRCALRLDLEGRDVPVGWRISGDPTKMGQLLLANDALGVDLRFLKERRRGYPGGVPPAGSNWRRKRAWSSNDEPLEGLDVDAPDAERTTILWVWDLDGPAEAADTGFTQRLVHTTAPGVYGRAVPCDLSIDIRPNGEIFDRLKFAGDPEDTDFFGVVELAETAEDGG